jgi:transposase
MGASGRRIIEAMIAGVRQPSKLAELASKQIKATPKELYDALHGRLTDHHGFLLEVHLRQWDGLDAAIRNLDREIGQRIDRMEAQITTGKVPFRALINLLDTAPGVNTVAASAILSEIGHDMSRFATAGHLLAWGGMCPGHNESAGKRKSSRLRKGAPWLKTMLVQCAWAAIRKKGSYYRVQFFRLQSRRGPQKAICAVAASLLTAIYHMLKYGIEHRDLGADHFDRRPTELKAKRLVAQLTKLGFTVQLQPNAQTA